MISLGWLAGVVDRIVVLVGGTNERTRSPRSSHLAVTSMGAADPAPHWFGRGTLTDAGQARARRLARRPGSRATRKG